MTNMRKRVITLLLVDDEPLVRQGGGLLQETMVKKQSATDVAFGSDLRENW